MGRPLGAAAPSTVRARAEQSGINGDLITLWRSPRALICVWPGCRALEVNLNPARSRLSVRMAEMLGVVCRELVFVNTNYHMRTIAVSAWR